MSLARPHDVVVLLAASLLVVLTAAPGADGACDATCQRDVARCMATQCTGVGHAACRRRCKPAAIRGTLAYVVTECRTDAAGIVVRQALRIRRGDNDPITVVKFPPEGTPSEPMPDPLGLCRQYGESRNGFVGVVAIPLQRLGVSPDGSGVVFEVTSETAVVLRGPPLPPDQQGMFFVRADGSGLRHLGPASHDPSFRIGPELTGRFIFSVSVASSIPFSPDGRQIAFTDLGPGPDGEAAVQIIVLDLATGQRTQVTHLPSGVAPADSFLTAYPSFIDNKTVFFGTSVDPDGLNPEHEFTDFTVRIDGSRLKLIPPIAPVAAVGSRVIPIFGVAQFAAHLLSLSVPGTPVNLYPGAHDPISEIFTRDGENLLQLTNFRRVDTWSAFLSVTRRRAFFRTSADPLGTNPFHNCQMFSISTLGKGLRQVTHFNPGCAVPQPGCGLNLPPGCVVGNAFAVQDPVTKTVLFDSSCDPFGANPFGGQIFAMRPDGSGLRQLTDAAGFTTNPDGSIKVELPGPFAYSLGPR